MVKLALNRVTLILRRIDYKPILFSKENISATGRLQNSDVNTKCGEK
jgi:hypothetical protein